MEENLERTAKWILRKTQQCHARSLDAQENLCSITQSVDFLQEQWCLQVQTQTQPLPSTGDELSIL